MHRLDHVATLYATAHVRLVSNHDKEKFRCLEPLAAVRNVLIEFEIFYARGRTGLTIADDGPVKHTIAIQEDGASRYFVLSHFVSATFRQG
jgi:hypothetical protein